MKHARTTWLPFAISSAFLLFGACGLDGKPGGTAPPVSSTDDASTSTDMGSASDDGTPVSDMPVSNQPAPDMEPPGDDDAGVPPTEDASTPVPPTYPADYIRSTRQNRLVLEVDSVEGFAPRPAATSYTVDRLSPVLDKPGGIEFVSDGTLPSRGADHVWTFDQLSQLADDNFDLEVDDGTAKIYVMYVDGSYDNGNGNGGTVLGVAWANRYLAIFQDVINDSCDRPLIGNDLCNAAESSILLHEVGHVIGLVNNGTPMVANHEDPDHQGHSDNDDCVMYWAYEGTGLIDLLATRIGGQNVELDFDQACKDDLAAVRGQ